MEWTDLNRSTLVERQLLDVAATLDAPLTFIAPSAPADVAYQQITKCVLIAPAPLAITLRLDDGPALPISQLGPTRHPVWIQYFLGQPLWRSVSVPGAMAFDYPSLPTHMGPFAEKTIAVTVRAPADAPTPTGKFRVVLIGYRYTAADLYLLEPNWRLKIAQLMDGWTQWGKERSYA